MASLSIREEIDKASQIYAKRLQDFDIKEIIKGLFPGENFTQNKNNEDIYQNLETKQNYLVLPYPGLIKENKIGKKKIYRNATNDDTGNQMIDEYSKYFSKLYDNIICVGILAFVEEHKCVEDEKHKKCIICEEGVGHYMAIVKTTKKERRIYVFDSATANYEEDNELEIFSFLQQKSRGSDYVVEGLKMTKEVQPSAGGSQDIIEAQNIFCHTWCLWFLKELFCSNIETMKKKLSESGSNISREKYNIECLGNIKKFAVYLFLNLLTHTQKEENTAILVLQRKKRNINLNWLLDFSKIYIDDEEIIEINDYMLVFFEEECWYDNTLKEIYGDMDDVPLNKKIFVGSKRKL